MSDIFKIVGIGFAGGILVLTLKGKRPEFALLVSLVTSLIITAQIFSGLKDITDGIYSIIKECGLDLKYFSVCIKAIGIAYVSQFGAELLRDSGETAVAAKVEVAGKMGILIITMPVMVSFLRLCIKVINGI